MWFLILWSMHLDCFDEDYTNIYDCRIDAGYTNVYDCHVDAVYTNIYDCRVDAVSETYMIVVLM